MVSVTVEQRSESPVTVPSPKKKKQLCEICQERKFGCILVVCKQVHPPGTKKDPPRSTSGTAEGVTTTEVNAPTETNGLRHRMADDDRPPTATRNVPSRAAGSTTNFDKQPKSQGFFSSFFGGPKSTEETAEVVSLENVGDTILNLDRDAAPNSTQDSKVVNTSSETAEKDSEATLAVDEDDDGDKFICEPCVRQHNRKINEDDEAKGCPWCRRQHYPFGEYAPALMPHEEAVILSLPKAQQAYALRQSLHREQSARALEHWGEEGRKSIRFKILDWTGYDVARLFQCYVGCGLVMVFILVFVMVVFFTLLALTGDTQAFREFWDHSNIGK